MEMSNKCADIITKWQNLQVTNITAKINFLVLGEKHLVEEQTKNNI